MIYLLGAFIIYSVWITGRYLLLCKRFVGLSGLLRESAVIVSRHRSLNEAYITTLRAYLTTISDAGIDIPDSMLSVFEKRWDDYDRNLNA